MNKIDQKLKEIQENKKIGLMTHVVVGYPSLQETVELVKLMEKCGVDMVELQIPFSDPLADGPTIMKACEVSLRVGTKVKDTFDIVENLNKVVNIPLLLMCYYNTVFRYGVENFCEDAVRVGISGLIVPDMPLDEEENEKFYLFAKKYHLHTIQVISPASTEERLKKVASAVNGFVYCTARQGITGVKKELGEGVKLYLKTVRKYFSLPLAVGFGISKPEHVKALIGNASIAVVGSVIIEMLDKGGDYRKKIKDFLNQANMVE